MTTRTSRRKNPQTGLYYPNLVPPSAIRRYARAIAEHFSPEKIILFGSYAYGTPTPDSDVDLLVVMATNDQVDQSVRIDNALEDLGIEPGFFLDLLVRTPRTLKRRMANGDDFLSEIMTRGRVLYEPVRACPRWHAIPHQGKLGGVRLVEMACRRPELP